MKLQFYLVDISYKVVDEKPVIFLAGRTKKGEQVVVEYHDFLPYLYAEIPTSKLKSVEGIKITQPRANYHVVGTESLTRKILGKETKVAKVFGNLPTGISHIKDEIRKLGCMCYEYDLVYTRRFLIDFGLTAMSLIECSAEPTPSGNFSELVTRYVAKEFKMLDEVYTTPEIMAVDIETYYVPGKGLDMKKQPILMIALYGDGFEKVLTYKEFKGAQNYVEVLENEKEMLKKFAEYVRLKSPDMLVGYNSDKFDLAYINSRAKELRVNFSIGLDGSGLRVVGTTAKKASLMGICHVDIYQFIRRVMRVGLKTDSLSLDAVSQELLGAKKADMDVSKLAAHWDAGTKLDEYAHYNLHDTRLTYDLAFKILPNITEFVRLIGVPLYDSARLSFSQQVEWYLIKRAFIAGEISPNRPGFKEQKGRERQRLVGGYVFTPTPGLYEDIIVFDFASLYPTIIASHNLGPSSCSMDGPGDTVDTPIGDVHVNTAQRAFLSREIELLITTRSKIKKELKKEYDALLYSRSMALKILANSMYGYLVFGMARWYSFEAGSVTTTLARNYVQNVMKDAKEAGFGVVYGDTDSAMLLLGDKTEKDAEAFKDSVNETLPGLMELEYEGHYLRGIFVAVKGSEGGAKKRYALINEKKELTIKGFEVVRRNFSILGKEIQKHVLELVLERGAVKEAVTYVSGMIKDLKEHKIPVEKMIIRTQLQKKTSEYDNVGPHVAAARLMEKKNIEVGPGSFIRYVVCSGAGLIRDKVKLPEDVKQTDYDSDYYLKHQVLPAVEKILSAVGYDQESLVMGTKQKKLGDW
jgi:DNA polymerase elongation subunit (family B)